VAPSNRLQLGVIGTNQGGFNWVRCNFPDVITVGVCDVDAGRRGSLTAGANHRHGGRVATGYADFREMFARAALDAVIIATPDHWHAPMAVAAARAGIAGIWGEKPLAHTLREGRAVVRAVNEHGTVWQTGSWQRSLPNFRRAVELVRAGVIGKVRRIEVVLHGYNFLDDVKAGEARGIGGERGKPPASLDYERWLGPAPWREYVPGVIHGNWRFCGDYGGGYLLDWIGHHFDIAQWGAGKDAEGPVRVAGSGVFEDGGRARGVEHYDAIRSYDFDCEYADGLVINVRGLPARRGHGMCGVTFRGENGRWIWCERGVPNRASHPEILTTNLGENASNTAGTTGTGSAQSAASSSFNLHPSTFPTGVYHSDNHWRNWLDCIKTRRTDTAAPAEAGHRSASAGHLGIAAMLTGRALRFDPVAERVLDDPAADALLSPTFRDGWGI
ncbi:MAG: Gfo/Idh/MocA family oxidoreductase, partial [Puniceicoccales bacterium]|jgi:predicted dehydrogenase|nr:Gfo/Idh/MocA family oxidoreductase [Puniceicoccales bacterium]